MKQKTNEELAAEIAGLKRQLTASRKPGTFMAAAAGLGAVLMVPVEKIIAKGNEVLETKHYASIEEQEVAEQTLEFERKLRAEKGLPVKDDFYPEA